MILRLSLIPALLLAATAAVLAQGEPPARDSLLVIQDSVVAHAQRIIARDSTDVDEYEKLIGVYKARKRYTIQLQTAAAMVRSNPASALAHLLLGDALLDNGDAEASLVQLRRALTLQPTYVRARVIVAEAYESLDLPDSALMELDTAIHQNPRHAQAHMQRARLLTRAGRLDAAAAEYRIACELLPDDAGAFGPWMRYAEALVRIDHYDEALDALRYCLRLQPSSSDALLKFAETSELAGKRRQALDAFEEFYYRFPRDARAGDAERAAIRLRQN